MITIGLQCSMMELIISSAKNLKCISLAVSVVATASVESDFNMVSIEEVKKLAGGDASGRVQR